MSTTSPSGDVHRVAVVTGGAGTIGGSIVRHLQRSGHTVVVVDRSGEFACDLGDAAQVREVADRILLTHGRCDVLVHCAATFDRFGIDDLDLDRWRHVQAVNVESLLILVRAFLPAMRRHGFGRVVSVVSNTIWKPPGDHLLAYVASKGALAAITRTLAVALSGDGIAVSGVAPGLTPTPGAQIPAEELADVLAHQPLPRTLEPDDVGAAVSFLSSDGAAAMTGQILVVDGGTVMR
jgi:NAD(P)-dependent dehydrogenase (short-subunit alcohol dehydrogenase family)